MPRTPHSTQRIGPRRGFVVEQLGAAGQVVWIAVASWPFAWLVTGDELGGLWGTAAVLGVALSPFALWALLLGAVAANRDWGRLDVDATQIRITQQMRRVAIDISDVTEVTEIESARARLPWRSEPLSLFEIRAARYRTWRRRQKPIAVVISERDLDAKVGLDAARELVIQAVGTT